MALGQDGKTVVQQRIPLTVQTSVPLRLYTTKRFSKKLDARVEARLLTPVYALDRPVIPAGTTVIGHVTELRSRSGGDRAKAILGGDFTPLHEAMVDFTTILLPGGLQMPLHALATSGLKTSVPIKSLKQTDQIHPADSTGVIAKGKKQLESEVSRVKSIPNMVKAPGKKDRLSNFFVSKLPYHPQYVTSGTRFDAELTQPLTFGFATLQSTSLSQLGTQPPRNSLVHARLLTSLDSRTATQGDKVQAVLEAPLFSGDHNLVLPVGTLLNGVVVVAKRARWFHRGGHLRFRFEDFSLPPEIALLSAAPGFSNVAKPNQGALSIRTEGFLAAAESSQRSLKVDSEGGVQMKDSNTRFIGTAISAVLAMASGDNDAIRNGSGNITGTSSNVAGRAFGGGLGFGLLGIAAAQSSRSVAMGFGYYGLAWSVFSTVISRGADVEFKKDSFIDVGFNSRNEPQSAKDNRELVSPLPK